MNQQNIQAAIVNGSFFCGITFFKFYANRKKSIIFTTEIKTKKHGL